MDVTKGVVLFTASSTGFISKRSRWGGDPTQPFVDEKVPFRYSIRLKERERSKTRTQVVLKREGTLNNMGSSQKQDGKDLTRFCVRLFLIGLLTQTLLNEIHTSFIFHTKMHNPLGAGNIYYTRTHFQVFKPSSCYFSLSLTDLLTKYTLHSTNTDSSLAVNLSLL